MKNIGQFGRGAIVRMLDVINYLKGKDIIGSDKDFCKAIGTNTSNIGRWRAGNGVPSVDEIGMTVKKFGVNPEWIISGTGNMFSQRDIPGELRAIQKEVKELQKLLQK